LATAGAAATGAGAATAGAATAFDGVAMLILESEKVFESELQS
jgi:hypothetical protein